MFISNADAFLAASPARNGIYLQRFGFTCTIYEDPRRRDFEEHNINVPASEELRTVLSPFGKAGVRTSGQSGMDLNPEIGKPDEACDHGRVQDTKSSGRYKVGSGAPRGQAGSVAAAAPSLNCLA
jgi:hypothetical protein